MLPRRAAHSVHGHDQARLPTPASGRIGEPAAHEAARPNRASTGRLDRRGEPSIARYNDDGGGIAVGPDPGCDLTIGGVRSAGCEPDADPGTLAGRLDTAMGASVEDDLYLDRMTLGERAEAAHEPLHRRRAVPPPAVGPGPEGVEPIDDQAATALQLIGPGGRAFFHRSNGSGEAVGRGDDVGWQQSSTETGAQLLVGGSAGHE